MSKAFTFQLNRQFSQNYLKSLEIKLTKVEHFVALKDDFVQKWNTITFAY